jgi:ornithine cyclodeaminase/alanine dehydrogenase-like protein (mu-crystallin family)
MTEAHEGTSPLWTDIRIENRLDTLDFIEHKDICYVDYGEVADFIEDEIRDDYEAALAEKEALVSELQDALDGMRGIAKGRLEKIAELEAQVRKLKAEKQEAIEMIRSLGLPIEDIEVETMTREQYEKEYGDDD